ncbi:MAG TPA: hypothetical protein VK919_13210 [Solirubrobacterales bacterium]|nr:hypothetical protein [Solirubrobacterales bacterium]
MSTISIRPVGGRRDLTRFIKLPFRLHRDSPRWVPPVVFERRRFLDRRRNPFFDHADAEYFLCERGGEVVGRISAQVDQRWDEFQGGSDAMFGFFEAEDDPDVARALVDAARGWARDRGRQRLLGPMDFTTNDECGLLVDGFDQPALILEPWHPPYYRDLLEGLGMTKAIDLLMWSLHLGELKQGDQFAPLIHAAAERSREKGVVVRNVRRRDIDSDFARLMGVYNEAWGRNWGFVPITDEERRFQTASLKPVLDEQWTMVAELDGKPIGGAITLPDINQALARMNGRLLPAGWWHFLLRRRYIDRVRVFALGVLPQYQHLGVAAALYVRHLDNAKQPGGIDHGHMGWILETNKSMNRAMEGMGGTVVKRYRIYEQPLG